MTQDRAHYWTGREGAAYVARQTLSIDAREAMFRRAFACLPRLPRSVIEFGASVGDNLRAIKRMAPSIGTVVGVEPNEGAYQCLRAVADAAYRDTMQGFHKRIECDVSFTRGVLIHVPPDDLPACYDALYATSRRWIMVAEYYASQPTEIEYRGRMGLLWKRDFAGEMLDRFAGRLRLVDYAFVYRRSPLWPQDDLTWFLMEKTP